MSNDLVKSPMQLKYELDKIRNELASLLKNRQRKKEESLSRMLNYRNQLKEIDAVMAAIEESYTAYCGLTKPILDLVKPVNILSKPITNAPESLEPDTVPSVINIISQIQDFTQASEAAETLRITRIRDGHQIQSEHIQRKSKEVYVALNEEKKNVDAYTILLQEKIQELEVQLVLETKTGGMGIGL